MVGSNASRLSSSDGRDGAFRMEMKVPDDLYPFALASLMALSCSFVSMEKCSLLASTFVRR